MDNILQTPWKRPETVTVSSQLPPFERLLRRRAKPLRADLFIRVAEWLSAERLRLGVTQKAMALQHRIPVRQIKTYEAVARWPDEVKALVIGNPTLFLVSDLTRLFANRSWRSHNTLLKALERHAAGKPPRRRYRANIGKIKDPNILVFEERLRDRLQTRVSIDVEDNGGELSIKFFSFDELDRLMDILGA